MGEGMAAPLRVGRAEIDNGLLLLGIQRTLEEMLALLRHGPAAPALAGFVLTRPLPTDKARFWQTLVDATEKEIIRANPDRISFTILNTGVATIGVAEREVGALGQESFPLPGGTALGLDNYTGPVWARSTAGAVTLALIELSR